MYIIQLQINSSSQCQKQDWSEHKKKCLKKLSLELLPYKEVGKILFKFFKLVQISVENRYICMYKYLIVYKIFEDVDVYLLPKNRGFFSCIYPIQ